MQWGRWQYGGSSAAVMRWRRWQYGGSSAAVMQLPALPQPVTKEALPTES